MKKLYTAVAILAAIAAGIRLYKALFGNDYGKHISVDKNNIYYTDKLTEADAKRTGDFLKRQGFYEAGKEKDIQLDKAGDTVLFKLIVDKEKVQGETEQALRSLNGIFSDSLFAQKPVNVLLCNDHFETYQTYAFVPAQATGNTTAADSSMAH